MNTKSKLSVGLLISLVTAACGGPIPIKINNEEEEDRELIEDAFGTWGVAVEFPRYPGTRAAELVTVTFTEKKILVGSHYRTGVHVKKMACAHEISAMRIPRTLAHEVGHFLGLDHSDSTDALMYGGGNGWEISDEDWDNAQICAF